MASEGDAAVMDEVKKLAICVYSDLMAMDRMMKSMSAASIGDPVMCLASDEVHKSMTAMTIARDLLCVARKRGAGNGAGADKAE